MTQSSQDSASGCLGWLLTVAMIGVAFWFFIPLSIPFEPKGLSFCDRHGGFAEVQGSLVDLMQHEGMVACEDGTVGWAAWGG